MTGEPPNENESAHTHSANPVALTSPIVVPPQDRTQGSDPGYWTCAWPSGILDSVPVSPEAMQIVTPWTAASVNAAETASISPAVTPDASAASSPLRM